MSSIDLQDIFESDDDGLLDTPEKPAKATSTDRLERSFQEIVEFYRQHRRVPRSDVREIAERKLGARLDGILANEEKLAALTHLDEFGLLTRAVAHGRHVRLQFDVERGRIRVVGAGDLEQDAVVATYQRVFWQRVQCNFEVVPTRGRYRPRLSRKGRVFHRRLFSAVAARTCRSRDGQSGHRKHRPIPFHRPGFLMKARRGRVR